MNYKMPQDSRILGGDSNPGLLNIITTFSGSGLH